MLPRPHALSWERDTFPYLLNIFDIDYRSRRLLYLGSCLALSLRDQRR